MLKKSNESVLKSNLSTTSLIVLGVSSTIGSGIYIVIGVVAKEHAGAYVILCFILGGLIALSNSLAYSELSCRYKGCGGIYTFVYKTWGITHGFLVGWLNLHGGVASISLGAQTFSSYIYQILDQTNVTNVTNINLSAPADLLITLHSYGVNLPAIVLVVLSTCILISGTTNLFNVTKITTSVSILALIFLIICGLTSGDVHNIGSFQPHTVAPIHLSGILRGTAICYFAYTGFSAVCSSSEEAKDARRSIPIAITLVMVFVGLLYCGVTVSVLMLQPYWLFDTKAPLIVALRYAHINWMRYIILVGMTVGLIQVNLSCLYQASRLVFSMARDRLLPRVFATVWSRNKTPVLAIIASGFLSGVVSSVVSFRTLISFTTISIFVNSTLANILIVWINCYTELSKTSNIESKLYDIVSYEESSKAVKSSNPEALQPITFHLNCKDTVLAMEESNIAKSNMQISNINCLTDDLSMDIKEFSKSPTYGKQTILPIALNNKCLYLQNQNILRVGTYDQKWYVIIALLTITCSSIFLAGTFSLYSGGTVDFHYSSLVTICVSGVMLIWGTMHLYALKCYVKLRKYLGIRMIMVPCLPIFNIFINIYLLVIMSDSMGFLCYIILLLLGMVLYSTVTRMMGGKN